MRRSYPSDTDNFDSFWHLGLPLQFPKGVCDRVQVDGTCLCEAGPALLSLNGNGWATGVPIVAFSDGYPGPQACYGDERDHDSSEKTVCPDLWDVTAPFEPEFPFEPEVGTPMFRVEVPLAPDFTIHATAADLLPGARLSRRLPCSNPSTDPRSSSLGRIGLSRQRGPRAPMSWSCPTARMTPTRTR